MTNEDFMALARMNRPNIEGMTALIAAMREIGWLGLHDINKDPGNLGRLQAAMITAAGTLELFVLHDLKAKQ